MNRLKKRAEKSTRRSLSLPLLFRFLKTPRVDAGLPSAFLAEIPANHGTPKGNLVRVRDSARRIRDIFVLMTFKK
ncbi:MAG: hypothetical protein AB9869_35060 [Verrucomicrobiia bacterium]